jgi:hypothetical protein
MKLTYDDDEKRKKGKQKNERAETVDGETEDAEIAKRLHAQGVD